MNGLSLRVSAVKGINAVRCNYECKQDILSLGFDRKTSLKSIEVNEFIQKFTNSNSVEEQLKLIKSTIGAQFTDSVQEEFLKLFVIIYFNAPLKHAIKNNLMKLIDQETKFHSIIIESLRGLITDSLVTTSCEQACSDLNNLVGKIGALLDNFKCGIEAFRIAFELIHSHFVNFLNIYLKHLGRPGNSPASKNELSAFIHNVLRIMIFAIQRFNQNIDCQSKTFQDFYEICWDVIDFIDIPIDTKANAGLLLVTIARELKKNILVEEHKRRKNSTIDLCLVFGAISLLDKSYVKENPDCIETIFEVLHPLIKSNVWEPCLILCVCRTTLQLSKKLTQVKSNLKNTTLVILISTACLDYAISNLDHYMDTVRHMSKDIIKNLLSLKEFPEILTSVKHRLSSDFLSKQNKCVVISCICLVYGGKFVCEEFPEVKSFLLSSMENNNSHNTNSLITNCYETLMYSSLDNMNIDQLFETFVTILIEKLNNTPNDQVELCNAVTNLVLKAIKKVPKIINNIQKCMIPINLRLKCLSTAKKSGIFDGISSSDEKWKEILLFKDIHKMMISSNDEIRMAALAIIVEAHKTTEIFTKKEFDSILHFLMFNINTQDPALRQLIIGHIRNICIRLQGHIKIFDKYPEDPNITIYKNFIQDITTFCFNNFFEGANLGRRTISLKILLQICKLLQDCHKFKINIWSTTRYELVLQRLEDTFESNKIDAMSLLKYFPIEYKKNKSNLAKNINLNLVVEMANSTKPANSLTAAYYLEYLLHIYRYEDTLPQELDEVIDKNVKIDIELRTLLWIEMNLEQNIKVVSKSLLEAASKCPMYGLLLCMRHILSKMDLKNLKDINVWRPFIGRLIRLSKALTDAVAPIVNSSSPEGHLPNDFSDVQIFIDESYSNSVKKITPQMVLLFAWRTVKEVSLILGSISYKAPTIQGDESLGIITVDQLLEIGLHFTYLLSETKHRGAFEQAYVGFSCLCVRLWSSDETELHTLPICWLKALVSIISGRNLSETSVGIDLNVSKLCATRRSAGIPFLMQALITTELQIGSSKGLKYCMENLIKLARTGNVESRTHALNILRSLFRCTDLGEAIAEYVADGFICAITGYDAKTWGERNSATLLFSALVIRVFGVQRTRDSENLNIRNRMTGRIFFLRYPKLYDFFYTEIEEAEKMTACGIRSRKIHPLLILMGRLYPSALEGVESNLQLNKFVPIVSRCCGNPEMKTRQLAAKIIPIFLQPDEVIPRIIHILTILNCDIQDVASNYIHGALLEVLSLVKALPDHKISKKSTISGKNASQFTQLLNHIKDITYKVLNFKMPPLIITVCFDILLEFNLKIHMKLPIITLNTQDSLDTISNIGMIIVRKKYAIYQILSTSKEISLNLNTPIHDYEYHETILNISLLIVDFDHVVHQADDFEISDLEIATVRNMDVLFKNELKSMILSSNDFFTGLNRILKDNFIHSLTVKVFILMSYSKTFVEHFINERIKPEDFKCKVFNDIAESKRGRMRDAVYCCFETYLRECSYKLEELDDLQLLKNITTAENSDNLRLTAVKILMALHKIILIQSEAISIRGISYYFWSLFNLLQDDNFAVRNLAAKLAIKLYNNLYDHQEDEEIIGSAGCGILFIVLKKLTEKNFKNEAKESMQSIIDTIKALDQESLKDDELQNENHCFDKNEGNIFKEKFSFLESYVKPITDILD